MYYKIILRTVEVIIFGFLTSCSGNSSPIISITAITTITPTSSGNQSETHAFPTNTSLFTPTISIAPSEHTPNNTGQPSINLPYNIYFLGYSDQLKNYQIFRLERNGFTISQVTNDPNGIVSFDTFPNSTGFVYLNKKQNLSYTDIQGVKTKILVADIPSPGTALSWSPDGKIIAYFNKGISFYYPDTNSRVFPDINHSFSQVLSPRQFSPDSKMLIFHMGDKFGIFNIDSGVATLLSIPSNNLPYSCCAPVYWSSDSSHIYIADYEMGGSGQGIRLPGLWRYTINGLGIDLLPANNIPGHNTSFTRVIAPWEDISNKYLYFLFSQIEIGVYDPSISFSLIRMVLDATTDCVTLRNEVFNISSPSQVIWSPDGSFILILENGKKDSMKSIILVPTNPDLPIRKFVTNASLIIGNFRWGPN